MIRSLIVLALAAFALFFAGLQAGYGSMDPCRALALEKARRSSAPTGFAHIWTRAETGQMGALACTRGLLGSWRDRLQS